MRTYGQNEVTSIVCGLITFAQEYVESYAAEYENRDEYHPLDDLAGELTSAMIGHSVFEIDHMDSDLIYERLREEDP